MKWINYKVLQSVTEDGDNIFVNKKVGYSEENIAIAQKEAYDGYVITEDDVVIEKDPLDVQGVRIKNVGEPVENDDAVNLKYLNNNFRPADAPTLRATYNEETGMMQYENVPEAFDQFITDEEAEGMFAPSGYGYGEALPIVTGSTDAEFLANIEALCAEKVKYSTFQAVVYPFGVDFDGNSFIAQIWHNTTNKGDKFIKIKAHCVTTTLSFQRVCYGNVWGEPELSADVVVAQGKSGVWTYRKWASGIAECWISLGMSTSPYTHALPFNFLSGVLLATVKYHDGVGYNVAEPVNGWVTKDNSIILYTKESGLSANSTYLVSVYVQGTWK